MRLTCIVRSVERSDCRLHVVLEKDSPYLGDRDRHRIIIPDTITARRAYYVGRRINLEANPK